MDLSRNIRAEEDFRIRKRRRDKKPYGQRGEGLPKVARKGNDNPHSQASGSSSAQSIVRPADEEAAMGEFHDDEGPGASGLEEAEEQMDSTAGGGSEMAGGGSEMLESEVSDIEPSSERENEEERSADDADYETDADESICFEDEEEEAEMSVEDEDSQPGDIGDHDGMSVDDDIPDDRYAEILDTPICEGSTLTVKDYIQDILGLKARLKDKMNDTAILGVLIKDKKQFPSPNHVPINPSKPNLYLFYNLANAITLDIFQAIKIGVCPNNCCIYYDSKHTTEECLEGFVQHVPFVGWKPLKTNNWTYCKYCKKKEKDELVYKCRPCNTCRREDCTDGNHIKTFQRTAYFWPLTNTLLDCATGTNSAKYAAYPFQPKVRSKVKSASEDKICRDMYDAEEWETIIEKERVIKEALLPFGLLGFYDGVQQRKHGRKAKSLWPFFVCIVNFPPQYRYTLGIGMHVVLLHDITKGRAGKQILEPLTDNLVDLYVGVQLDRSKMDAQILAILDARWKEANSDGDMSVSSALDEPEVEDKPNKLRAAMLGVCLDTKGLEHFIDSQGVGAKAGCFRCDTVGIRLVDGGATVLASARRYTAKESPWRQKRCVNAKENHVGTVEEDEAKETELENPAIVRYCRFAEPEQRGPPETLSHEKFMDYYKTKLETKVYEFHGVKGCPAFHRLVYYKFHMTVLCIFHQIGNITLHLLLALLGIRGASEAVSKEEAKLGRFVGGDYFGGFGAGGGGDGKDGGGKDGDGKGGGGKGGDGKDGGGSRDGGPTPVEATGERKVVEQVDLPTQEDPASAPQGSRKTAGGKKGKEKVRGKKAGQQGDLPTPAAPATAGKKGKAKDAGLGAGGGGDDKHGDGTRGGGATPVEAMAERQAGDLPTVEDRASAGQGSESKAKDENKAKEKTGKAKKVRLPTPWRLSTKELALIDKRLRSICFPKSYDEDRFDGFLTNKPSGSKTITKIRWIAAFSRFSLRGILRKTYRYMIHHLSDAITGILANVIHWETFEESFNHLMETLAFREGLLPITEWMFPEHTAGHILEYCKRLGPVRGFWMTSGERGNNIMRGFIQNQNHPIASAAKNYSTYAASVWHAFKTGSEEFQMWLDYAKSKQKGRTLTELYSDPYGPRIVQPQGKYIANYRSAPEELHDFLETYISNSDDVSLNLVLKEWKIEQVTCVEHCSKKDARSKVESGTLTKKLRKNTKCQCIFHTQEVPEDISFVALSGRSPWMSLQDYIVHYVSKDERLRDTEAVHGVITFLRTSRGYFQVWKSLRLGAVSFESSNWQKGQPVKKPTHARRKQIPQAYHTIMGMVKQPKRRNGCLVKVKFDSEEGGTEIIYGSVRYFFEVDHSQSLKLNGPKVVYACVDWLATGGYVTTEEGDVVWQNYEEDGLCYATLDPEELVYKGELSSVVEVSTIYGTGVALAPSDDHSKVYFIDCHVTKVVNE